MAGHSKWANIKHRKATQDVKRGKVFTKIIRELVVAAKQGGGSIDDNPKLRQVVDSALAVNMTRDTINRAIARGAGNGSDTNMDEALYEGYAPDGIAVLVECLTDNKNRTVAEVRHAFSKYGGALGSDGSVAYLFERKGQIYYPDSSDEEVLLEAALDAGAEDVIIQQDGSIEVITNWSEFMSVKDALATQGFTATEGDIARIPELKISLNEIQAEKLFKLIDHLEDLDDVQNVYTNANIADEILAKLSIN